jgi:RHS repeat-associated protein
MYPWGALWTSAGDTEFDEHFAGFTQIDGLAMIYPTPARRYAPPLGRWLTPDPMGGDLTNPQSLNRYAYALNNPETLTDPLGTNPNAVCLEANRGAVMRTSCGWGGPTFGSGSGGGGFSIDGGMSLDWSMWGNIGGMANSFGGASESTAVCMMSNCDFPASGYNEANPQNPDLYQWVHNPNVIEFDCTSLDPGSCHPALWSLQYVAGPNDALPPGVAAALSQVSEMSAPWVYGAAIGTVAAVAGPPVIGEAAVLSEGLGWNISGTWGAFRQFTVYNTYGNLFSVGVDAVNGWHIGILASETGHSLWHIPLNPLNWW